MSDNRYVRVAALKNAGVFRRHLESSGIDLAFDDELLPPADSPFGAPFVDGDTRVGNRFCVLPMEGWDGTTSGEPSDLTRRRWKRFGASGAKLIWGGEAVAVRHDGRANPNQLLMSETNEPALAALRDDLVAAHRERFGANADERLVPRPATDALGPLLASERLEPARSRSPRTPTPYSTSVSPAACA